MTAVVNFDKPITYYMDKKKPNKNSANDGKHPYLIDSKWIDGTLCFWRDSPGMYSKETYDRLEDGIKKLKEKSHKIYIDNS